PRAPAADAVPAALLKERLPAGEGADREAHDGTMRRLLHVAMTRTRKGLVLSWAPTAQHGPGARPSPFIEEARGALGAEEESYEEQLFGPAEGLHSTFRMMRDERRRREAIGAPEGETLEPFIPRRGDGLMLSASDIETYRICPLKYKFARVFRIPQEPTINQRFGILLHQVLERFHQSEGASLDHLMQLFEISWRR